MTAISAALAAYDRALETGSGLEAAAALMAAALRAKPRKAAGPADLSAPFKVGRRAKFWGAFVVRWADGTETRVTGVVWDKPADKLAAAFQAADRLRRSRSRNAWEGEPGAPSRWTYGPNRVRIESAAWWNYCKGRALPPLASIAEEGEPAPAEAVAAYA